MRKRKRKLSKYRELLARPTLVDVAFDGIRYTILKNAEDAADDRVSAVAQVYDPYKTTLGTTATEIWNAVDRCIRRQVLLPADAAGWEELYAKY